MHLLDKPEKKMTKAELKRLNFMRSLLVVLNSFSLRDHRYDYDFTAGSRIGRAADLLFRVWDLDSLKAKKPEWEAVTFGERMTADPSVPAFSEKLGLQMTQREDHRNALLHADGMKISMLRDLFPDLIGRTSESPTPPVPPEPALPPTQDGGPVDETADEDEGGVRDLENADDDEGDGEGEAGTTGKRKKKPKTSPSGVPADQE